MDEPKYEPLELAGLHEPDVSIETDAMGHKHAVPLPGMFHIGFLKDGVFRPIHSIKAAGLFADIERAKEKAKEQGTPEDGA